MQVVADAAPPQADAAPDNTSSAWPATDVAPEPATPSVPATPAANKGVAAQAKTPAAAAVLVVEDLRVSFPSRDGGRTEAVRGVSFTLGRERLGIVGESGSGKSQTGRAILGLTAPEGLVTAKRLEFHGKDLLNCSSSERRKLRGGRIAMVLQDPKFSLNPVMTIGNQVVETLRTHSRVSAREARVQALAALAAVQIDQPERVYKLYPHEVSGGMGQRAMIAMMLIANPELLIADEPTSALDVTVQLQVLGILDALVIQRGMGLIFISHDLRLVSTFCDRILVMYAGKVVEEISSGGLADAKHPYTRGLLNCLPRLADGRHPLPTLDRQPEWAL
ncbi:MAG: ABC transporter ATP-binding protein [Rhodoferax sp.]|nr:ABC transporter ATP-binding protein [Rhodoferax sp.]